MSITNPTDNLAAAVAYTRTRYGISDEAREYQRRRGPDKLIEPTEKDWELYHAALEAINAADTSPHIWIDADIDEPETRRTLGDYTETEDEWLTRVGHLLTENNGDLPDDISRALSHSEFFQVVQTFLPNGYGVTTEALENFPETPPPPSATSSPEEDE